MENNKEEQKNSGQQDESAAQLKRTENEGQQGNDYSEDQGEDENGPKPSADEDQ